MAVVSNLFLEQLVDIFGLQGQQVCKLEIVIETNRPVLLKIERYSSKEEMEKLMELVEPLRSPTSPLGADVQLSASRRGESCEGDFVEDAPNGGRPEFDADAHLAEHPGAIFGPIFFMPDIPLSEPVYRRALNRKLYRKISG